MASKGHGGLGKGLGALLKNREITPAKDQVQEIAASEIQANRYQPRQSFDEEALEDLSESIRQYGILQPLIVRRLPGKGYELIAGERRLRAARKAGLEKVPALVREYNDAEISEIALIENIQRENLNIIEEAEAYAFLMKNFQLTQEMLAKKVGRSRPHIANSLRLLELAEEIQDKLVAGDLLMGQARPLPAAISIVPAYPGFQNFPSPALILFRYSPHENHPHRQVHDCIRLSRTVPLKNLPFPFPFYSGDKKHRYSTFHLNRNRHGQETNLSHPV